MGQASLDIAGLAEAKALCQRFINGLQDLSELHEWYVIAAQAFALEHWPTSPALGPLTIAARSRGGSKPLFDTGQLWRSVTGGGGSQISKEPGSLNEANSRWGRLGSNLIQAALLNFGGVVTPKRAKYLAVPMTPKASKAGSPTKFAGPLALIPMRSRPGYLMVEGESYTVRFGPNRGQTKIRARKIGDGRYIAHYMLTKRIVVPGRQFIPNVAQLLPDLVDATNRYYAYIGKAA